MKILLGSESPRRKELLKSLGYEFETVTINCDEIYPEDLSAGKVAGYLSELKSHSFRILSKGEVLITSDTVVVIDDEILGKPIDKNGAIEMLQKLSGKVHQVYTGVTLRTDQKLITKTDVANVHFDEINETEIDYYVSHFEVLDKAGGYGVQDWLGMAKINKIVGSFYTVMGFPTHLVYEMLENLD